MIFQIRAIAASQLLPLISLFYILIINFTILSSYWNWYQGAIWTFWYRRVVKICEIAYLCLFQTQALCCRLLQHRNKEMFPSVKNLHWGRKQFEAQTLLAVFHRHFSHNRNFRRLRVPGDSLFTPMGSWNSNICSLCNIILPGNP